MDMGMMAPSSSSSIMNNGTMHHKMKKMMTQMTFFWGNNAEILFHGWPGDSAAMYALTLLFVFLMSLLVECVSHSRFLKAGSTRNFAAGLVETVLHAVRIGVAYLVMLALMSFNGGVFLAAVAGHTLGFFLFGSRAFQKTNDLPRWLLVE